MNRPTPLTLWMAAACLSTFASGSSFGAGSTDDSAHPPPAGQMCPPGAYVTGFDTAGNIVCGHPGEAAAATTECPAVSCPPAAEPRMPAAAASPAAVAAETGRAPPADQQPAAASAQATPSSAVAQDITPVIDQLKPWSVAWGSDEVTIAVLGSGFTEQSKVIFQGVIYTPSPGSNVNSLEITLKTRGLAMGRYPITVSNGPDHAQTLPGAFYIY